jgi:acyl carrier protein phosphodiesterase
MLNLCTELVEVWFQHPILFFSVLLLLYFEYLISTIDYPTLNFLAHLYLSQNNTDIMTGNFMADSVKGNKFKQYTADVQKGILLHREIDSFTDTHDIVRRSKRRLHERYGLYAGVVIDIFYDHFLAKNWDQYSAIPLEVYVNSVYQILNQNFDVLPPATQNMLPYMIEYDWLYNYQFLKGMQEVFDGMNRRTKNRVQMNLATQDLQEHYQDFESDFTEFFADLKTFSDKKLASLQIA